jgi:hypothetical protein
MTVHMKPGQWDFFWDWHVEAPELTLADMLRIIREQEEAAAAEEAAAEEADTEAWNLTQEAMATEDQRLAVAERLEADAAALEDRMWHLSNAARAYRGMAERLRLQIEAPAPAEEAPRQTWMERFKEQKQAAAAEEGKEPKEGAEPKWGDMWYDQAGYVSITPVTSNRC